MRYLEELRRGIKVEAMKARTAGYGRLRHHSEEIVSKVEA